MYLRVGDADLAVTPYTTDGDLAVDPAVLAEIPPLERALVSAGFQPKTNDSVGVWIATRTTSQEIDARIAVDLLVPERVSPGGGKRARCPAPAARHRDRRSRHRYASILADARSAACAQLGRTLLEAQFARRARVGVEMAIRSAGVLGDADEIAAQFEALVGDLLDALPR